MKRIIVCCDGTWNADDTQTNDTNVAIMARSIRGSQQTGGTLQSCCICAASAPRG
jgi:uncharacterized protein (DUF2235 family)